MLDWLDFQASPSLWDDVAATAVSHRARLALRCGDESWTYGDLLSEARRIRDWLHAELDEGPILFAPRSTPSQVALILGAIGSGHVPVLADPAWTTSELAAVIERCRIRTLVSDAPGAGLSVRSEYGGFHLLDVASAPPDGTWSVPAGTTFGRFTSGTTGMPRCLAFTDRAALGAAAAWAQAARISSSDRVLCIATLSNGLAFNTSLFTTLLTGATLAFHPGRLLPGPLGRTLAAT